MSIMFKIQSFGMTDIGLKRQKNQDNFLVDDSARLYIVADGMGGHLGGETASKVAVEEIRKYIIKSMIPESPTNKIENAVKYANARVHKLSRQKVELSGMGTTVSSLFIRDNSAYIAQVGDSRVYLFRDGNIWQLTQDHSLVQEKFRSGLITREEIKKDKMKNIITRSVGFEADVLVDSYKKQLEKGDVFLICCDGLYGMIDDDQLLEIVQSEFMEKNNMEDCVKSLIQRANENGGEDNISAILVHIK